MIDIRLSVVGANQTEVHLGDNMLFFSYNTLVGIFGPLTKVANGLRSTRYYVTSKQFSKTTSRHITEWLGGAMPAVVSQEELEALALTLGGK